MDDARALSCFSVGSVAGAYDEIYLPRIFIPWARLLLERAALRPGEAVLDIATGPASVARIAAEQVGPRGRVVGADFSEAMIAIARTKPPSAGSATIDYVVSPAAPLEVESGLRRGHLPAGSPFLPRSAGVDPRDVSGAQAGRPCRGGGVAGDHVPAGLRRPGCCAARVLAGRAGGAVWLALALAEGSRPFRCLL